MRSEGKIFGKGLTPSDKEKSVSNFEKAYELGGEVMPGEIEKSGEFMLFIEVANEYIAQEFEELGIERDAKIDPDHIHLFLEEEFDKQFPDSEANGLHFGKRGSIAIKERAARLQTFKTTLHEMIHGASFITFGVNKAAREGDSKRSGYLDRSIAEDDHEHFRGLNEGIVDRITAEIGTKHADELKRIFKISDEEARTAKSFFYRGYMEVLKTLTEGIAAAKGEEESVVWERFKKGEFTGEMMHLRDIEDVFGKGALRVIAALGSGTKSSVRGEITEKKVLEYLQEPDPAERDRIANEILIERERLRRTHEIALKKKPARS